MAVLLAQNEIKQRSMLAFLLESSLNIRVVEVDSGLEKFDSASFDKKSPIEGIIWVNPKPLVNISEKIKQHGIKFNAALILGDQSAIKQFPEIKCVEMIDQNSIIESLYSNLGKLLKQGVVTEEDPQSGFRRVKTEILTRISPIATDVYVKVADRYIKIFSEGDVFNTQDEERYSKIKKIPYFFIQEDDAWKYVDQYKAELGREYLGSLNQDRLVDDLKKVVSKLDLQGSQEKIMLIGGALGFSADIRKMISSNVDETIVEISKNKKLNEILQTMRIERGKYIAAHSSVLCHLSGLLASRMTWSSDLTFKKLTYASLFHDCTLTNQKLAEIETEKELEARKSEFTEVELKSFKTHSSDAYLMVNRFPEVPPDVSTIILQHHELADGTGFPASLEAGKISPLSAVFIIAHDLTNYFFKTGKAGFKLSDFVSKQENVYTSGQFKKIFFALTNEDK